MPVDSSIALGVRPVQVPDRMNMLAQVLQIQGAQQSQQLHAMQADQMRRGIAAENALNDAYKGALGPDGMPDRNKLFQTLAGQGYGSKIPALQKQFMEADKAQGDVFKAAGERYKLFQQTLGSQFNNPNLSKDSVLQTVSGLVDAGAFDRGVAQRLVASLPDNPEQLRGHLRSIVSSQMTPEQMLTAFAPKPEKMDNGQQISFRDTNPNSPTYGQVTAGAAVQKVATPDAELSAQTSTANNIRSVSAARENAAATRAVAQATRDAASIQRGFESEQGLRKEFEALPEVKNYKQALPSYKAIEDAVKRNSTQSDINIVYGLAKLYDPNSVVREGEYATVANSPNIPERIKGYAQYLAGGGKLTPQVKAQILAEAQSRMKSYEDQFSSARGNYESIAKRTNVDPTRVFPSPMAPAVDPNAGSGGLGRQASGKVSGPSILDQADAILRGGK